MQYLFLSIFLIATAIHLYASLKRNQHLRNLTKPFILPALLGFYVFAADKVMPAVVLALVFSWLGDVLLMKHGTKWFAAGGIAFFVGHVFFVLSYLPYISFPGLSPVFIILLAVFFTAVVSFIFSKLRPHLPGKLFWPMFAYLLVNGAMNCFAIYRLASNPCAAAVITCVGAILFFISDSSLFFVRFNKNGRLKTHFLVMLTYSVGELLIILGLL